MFEFVVFAVAVTDITMVTVTDITTVAVTEKDIPFLDS